MSKKLVILGNGFDLQAGLKSSFNDYFQSITKENDGNPKIEFFELKTDFSNLDQSIKRNDWATGNTELQEYFKTDNHNYNLADYDKSLLDYIIYLNKENEMVNWNDIEYTIYEILTLKIDSIALFVYQKKKNSNYTASISNSEKLIDFLIAVIIVENLPTIKNISSPKEVKYDVINFFKEQLTLFETNFSKYLARTLRTDTSYNQKAINLLENILSMSIDNFNNEISILNFNYTEPFSEIENINYNNIHGNLEDVKSKIIIGIDESKLVDEDYNQMIIPFTKTYRIMDLEDRDNILNKNIKEIYVYGHSLSEADYSYFQSIFDYLNIYDSDVKIIFSYSKYGNKEISEIKAEQFDRIEKLLKEYGKTLDNKDHGKNLLHKLLLEGRLVIKEVQSTN